jgi:hypothetical protein
LEVQDFFELKEVSCPLRGEAGSCHGDGLKIRGNLSQSFDKRRGKKEGLA